MTSAVDAVVVGAGPAGLLAALALERRGLSVRVVERRAEPEAGLDKPCGEGLMPFCVEAFESLGVDLAGAGLPFRGIEYLDESSRVRADFGGRSGLGVRRTELSRRLLRAVRDAGIEIWWDCTTTCRRDGDRWVAETPRGAIAGAFVVGADGLRSQVRSQVGLARGSRGARRFGVRRHVAVRPWNDAVEVHWGPGSEAYVTPVADDEVGIALLWTETADRSSRGWSEQIRHFPRLAERLGDAPATRPLGCGPLRQPVRAVVRDNVALVGDASGYVDAITGEGLALAALQIGPLARAVAAGELGEYARVQRRIRRVPERLTELTLLLSRWPGLRRRVLRAWTRDPRSFEGFLGVLAGGEPQALDLARPGLQLLARLARA